MIDHEETRRSLEDLGIAVQVLPVRSFFGFGTARLARAFRAYLRQHGIRIFHAFDMPFAIFGAPVARLARTPTVLTSCRGHRALYEPKHQKLLAFSDRFADGIVCNAQALLDDMKRRGFDPATLHLCHNGIDLAPFGDVRRELPGGPITIGTVAVLRPEKNLQSLLRAFAALPERASLRLRITGSGPETEPLQSLAESLGLRPPEFHLQAAVSNIAAELRQIDIFVLPSLSEGFSNSIMEAMACGCTVAASAVGGNPELVRDRETGLLFDPEDVDSLTSALRELVADRALRERLAGAGSRFLRGNFSMSASAARMSAIYDRYLEA
jgi:glycosyltransferase involved in cell wall biosynthesis